MFYAILGIFVVVALFLIFRDDHDDSYNKNEKGPQKAQPKQTQQQQPKQEQTQSQGQTQYQKEAGAGHKADTGASPKAEKKASGPSLKEQILGEIEQAINEAKKGAEEPMKMFGEAMDRAKEAVNSAMKEAQKGWSGTDTQADVDEQFPADDEELDLSFLDIIDYFEDLEENTETFDISGLRYHSTVHDCGIIVGMVKPEPSNVHDPRAQAVYRNDGKLLGYIPRTQLEWYEDFNEQNVPCPFVGKIELDRSSAQLIAEIKVIIPSSREYVEAEIEEGL